MDMDLADRVARLEHIEDLKQLKYRYCAAVDANYDADAIAAMFTEDGVWDGADLGYYEGRDAIRESFTEPNATVMWMRHCVFNPIIELSGDRARCQWYMWLPKILVDRTTKTFQGGTHVDDCRLVDGRWYFKTMQVRLTRMP